MPVIESHTPGAFCWFELGTTDQAAAKQFYTALFGWSFNDFPIGPSEKYTIFQLGGEDAAAAYTLRDDQKSQGVPPHWLVYVAVENADEAGRRSAELGGQVYAGPFDVSDHGRMAVLADSTGAVFAVWQKKNHKGVGVTGENGTVCWADLSTPDSAKARHFYHELFGWNFVEGEKDTSGYLHIKNHEQFIGGVPSPSQRNPNAPPHWMIYFQVADCDVSTSKAKTQGAHVIFEPMSMEHVGRFSILNDPQGAVFSLFQPETR
ncbi:MAG: VOC family protein [Acidobacteriaceae bacterium]|nr:VOC family protein [Acidobacteriaceae bacterium]MBV9778854.1 VOC family protein [Acidobacteriaceae bacterium]